jgi:hypothetical protein
MIYWACSTTPGSTTCLSSTIYNDFILSDCQSLLIQWTQKNSFLYLVMRSSLLAGHVPICSFRSSLWAFISSQWNSMDWYSFPHLHFASSLHLVGYFHSCITMHGFMNVMFINGYRKAVTKILCHLILSYHHRCGNNTNNLFMIMPRSFSVALEVTNKIYNLELQVRFCSVFG